MKGFGWNIALALAWAAVTGNVTPSNLVVGFGIGLLILVFAGPVVGSPDYLIKVRQVIGLVLFFTRELIKSNLRIAYDVLTPQHHMRPGVIAIPLDAQTGTEITLLSNMITLTPGTLSLDISADRKTLYLHDLYIDDIDAARRRIKDGFERRILEVLR